MEAEEQISDLLVRWDSLREQGRLVSAEELCQDSPQLVEQVRAAIRALEAVYRVPNKADVTVDRWTAPQHELSRALPNVTSYDVLGELGRGGMGVVYKAKHTQLKRIVAIKVIRSGLHAGAHELARFRLEAEAAARLHHPNIVQIFEISEQANLPCLVLEFVDGPSLAEALQHDPFPPRPAAEIVKSVAQALHFAHKHNIVHRDLKPSNILLSVSRTQGEQPADQAIERHTVIDRYATIVPKIADFGLAKLLDCDSDATQTGTIMGSPGYMAPEQVDGRTRDIGPATDIYALGVILYEMIAGRPPFAGRNLLETMDQIRSDDAVAPSRWNREIPRDLEAICLKCLEKDPANRYPSAELLARDLDNFLGGELISARRFGATERLARLLRREGTGQFRTLSNLLLLISPVPFVSNLVAYLLVVSDSQFAVPAFAFVALMSPLTTLAIFFRSRGRAATPATAAERQFWSIWFGVPVGSIVLFLAYHRPPTPGQPLPDLWMYPALAVMHGLAFCAMGSSFWGGTYVAGIALFASALFMPIHIIWAPLEFGLVLSAVVFCISLHLRRRQIQLGSDTQ